MPSYMPKTLHKKTRYLEGHSCNAVQVIPNTVTDTGSGWADCQQMFTSPDIFGVGGAGIAPTQHNAGVPGC